MEESNFDEQRYRSRKWILHKNTAIAILGFAATLVICRLFGVESAPDVSFTLKWAATATGAVLGAYSTANIVTRKVDGGSK